MAIHPQENEIDNEEPHIQENSELGDIAILQLSKYHSRLSVQPGLALNESTSFECKAGISLSFALLLIVTYVHSD